jgi:hypothetical protein
LKNILTGEIKTLKFCFAVLVTVSVVFIVSVLEDDSLIVSVSSSSDAHAAKQMTINTIFFHKLKINNCNYKK